jgi:uncharacterized membrane protein YfcA
VNELLIEVASGVAVGLGMGLVGAGGAIFTVPVFGTLLGHGTKDAIAEALAVTGCIAAGSGAIAGARGLVDWGRVVSFGAAGIVGAQVAAPIAVRMAASLQVAMFAVVAGYAAWRMWGSAGGAGVVAGAAGGTGGPVALDAGHGSAEGRRAWWKPYVIGGVIGMLTSLLGVGGGFLLIPALAVHEGLPMTRAVATSLVVIAINASAGIAGLWLNGGLDGGTFHGRPVAIMAGCGVVGSVVGAAIQRRVPQAALRRVFAVLLLAVTVVMVVKVAPGVMVHGK